MPRLSPSSRLIQHPCPTLDPEAVLAVLRAKLPAGTVTPDVERHVREWCRLGPKVGIYPGIGIGQTLTETGNYGALPGWPGGKSWKARRNPASIGIVSRGGGEPDHDTMMEWADGTLAARAQIVHLLAYADLRDAPPEAALDALTQYAHLNARLALIPEANRHSCRTIADLGMERFAWDSKYGQKISDRVNDVLGSVLDAAPGTPPEKEPPPVVTTIPAKPDRQTPTIYYLSRDYARFGLEKWQADDILASRFVNRNGGRPEFIVFHIQDGYTFGSLDYWSSDVIDASSHVMVQRDGSVLYIIGDQDGSWTNGDVNYPTAEAREVLAYGGNPNNWTLTIEAEGFPGGPFPQVQLDSIIWVAETWIIKHPQILKHIWSMLRHRHINSKTRWRCPDEGTNDQSLYFAPVVAGVNGWLEAGSVPVTTRPPALPATTTPAPVTPGTTAAPTVPTTPPPVVNPPGGTDQQPEQEYPAGMTFELAKRLYGRVTVPWSSKEFVFNPERSECQYWLARGSLGIGPGEDYTAGEWPELNDVIRRGETKEVHVYQYSNGDVYEKVVRKDR